jgi:hypothetical protein
LAHLPWKPCFLGELGPICLTKVASALLSKGVGETWLNSLLHKEVKTSNLLEKVAWGLHSHFHLFMKKSEKLKN